MFTIATMDAVIFGGGAAGLWVQDLLTRRGFRTVLLENACLGSGQTVVSQGIIHGGLKYTLSGALTSSARAISDMPLIWRRCLAGEAQPDLSQTRLRSNFCYLWQTRSLRSRVAMLGARVGLQVKPVALERHERPAILTECPGTVARLDEQVIEPVSLIDNFVSRQWSRILKIDTASGLELERDAAGNVTVVRLLNPDSGDPLDIRARSIILLAGAGNEGLLNSLGIEGIGMQRRPLHMVVMRGRLPELHGHCVDGAATRVTISSTHDATGSIIWQLGGNLAEQAVSLDRHGAIQLARRELRDVLPALNTANAHWMTYRVDRAEAASEGARPEGATVVQSQNVIVGWPTKLALVPRLAEEIAGRLPDPMLNLPDCYAILRPWPRPEVALPVWEQEERWIVVD